MSRRARHSVVMPLITGGIKTLKKIFRWIYHFRRVFSPLLFALGVDGVALLWQHSAPQLWPLAFILVGLGIVVGFCGPFLSERVTKVIFTLVPDSIDAGRKGVLDRLPERIYSTALLIYIGIWLALRVHGENHRLTDWLWYVGTLGFGVTWWWHRRIRVAGRASRYARRWRTMADPTKTTNPKFKVFHSSKVVGVTGTNRGVSTLTIRLAHGATAADVVPVLPNIASWYRLRAGAVSLAEDKSNSSRVILRFTPRDPWAGKINHPLPEPGSLTLNEEAKRLKMGVYANGSPLMWSVSHALVVGQSGSGKSVWLESLLVWLTAAQDVVIVGADMASGATLGVWRKAMAMPLAEDYDSTIQVLEGVMRVIEDREKRLGITKETDSNAEDAFEPSIEFPWLIVIIDEYPEWVAEAQLRGHEGRSHLSLIGRIAKRARKAGVRLILAAQNGSKADVGSKELQAQLLTVVGLGLDAHANRVLWKELIKKGWSSNGLKVGQFMLRDPDHLTPEVAKGYFVGARERRDHIRSAVLLNKRLEPSAHAALTSDSPVTPLVIKPSRSTIQPQEAVLSQLRKQPGTVDDLVARTELSRATVYRRLKDYKATGQAYSRHGMWHLGSK